MLSRMLTLFLLAFSLQSIAQRNTATTTTTYNKNETAIRALLAAQTKAWNEGNLADFMEGYLPSDSLLFVGKSGPTYGFNNTLNNYKKGYPDTASMGKLTVT